MKSLQSEKMLSKYARWAEPILLIAAVVFLIAYAWPIIDLELAPRLQDFLSVLRTIIWVLFFVDYIFRLAVSADRWKFIKGNLIDLLIILLPMFRPLRLLRLLFLLRFLDQKTGKNLQGKVAWYAISSAVLAILIGALAELSAEQQAPGAIITNFSTALWWALTTVSTVGYGDTYPVTTEGRVVATVLMVYGIGLLGTVTGMLASWLVDKVDAADALRDSLREEEIAEDSRRTIAHLEAEIVALRADIAELAALTVERAGSSAESDGVEEVGSAESSGKN